MAVTGRLFISLSTSRDRCASAGPVDNEKVGERCRITDMILAFPDISRVLFDVACPWSHLLSRWTRARRTCSCQIRTIFITINWSLFVQCVRTIVKLSWWATWPNTIFMCDFYLVFAILISKAHHRKNFISSHNYHLLSLDRKLWWKGGNAIMVGILPWTGCHPLVLKEIYTIEIDWKISFKETFHETGSVGTIKSFIFKSSIRYCRILSCQPEPSPGYLWHPLHPGKIPRCYMSGRPGKGGNVRRQDLTFLEEFESWLL